MKKINPKFAFNSADYGIVKKEAFATVVTSSYTGKAYEEVFRKTLGGAPTVDFFGASAIQSGYKSKVQVPVLQLDADAVFQEFDNDCVHTATNSQLATYTEVVLKTQGILDEVCAEKFIGDYFENNMPAGANDPQVPQPWEDSLISVYTEAQARGLEKFVWNNLSPIFESGTAGGANAGMYDTTGVLADWRDSTKVRALLSAFLVGYAVANPEISLMDIVIVLPVAINQALQSTFINAAIDNSGNATAQFGKVFGVNDILVTYACNQSRVYLMKKNQVVMATDAANEWTGIDIKNLGEFDAKKRGQIQYSNQFRFGVTLMLPGEAGVIKLA